jgi:predicted nucleotidyltransferase
VNFLEFLRNLTRRGADFVIVGGVAARLHGSTRLTHDVDIVPSLHPEAWRRAIDAIWESGGRPRIPEPLERIRDVTNVEAWMKDQGMLALSFRSPDGSAEIDLLVSESRRLAQLKQRAVVVSLDDVEYYVAGIEDLIAMKKAAGRPQDLLDIEELRRIADRLAR